MKQFFKYGGYILGLLMLTALIFPDLFIPLGITGAFALALFAQPCAKNTAGATKVFVAQVASITAITGTTEITAITGTTPFMRVDTIRDTVYWNQKGEAVGKNNWKETNEIGFSIMPPALATNTFMQALIDGSPCGFMALVIDGNGKVWLVGYNVTDAMARPLRLTGLDQQTGKGLSEEAGNTIPIVLGNECGGLSMPLDSTLSALILAGTSTLIDWV